MSKKPRRNHSPTFKAKVAVDAIKGEKTLGVWAAEGSRNGRPKFDLSESGRIDFSSRPWGRGPLKLPLSAAPVFCRPDS